MYIFDVTARTTMLVSMTSKGQAANAASRRPALSDDGEVVAYESLASNLGSRPGCPRAGSDTNLLPDVYAFDRARSCVARISGSSGAEWWAPSVAPAIDALGGTIVFSSAQPSDADDPTTDFDLFHALIRQGSRERLRKARHIGCYVPDAFPLAAAVRIAPQITMTLAPASRLGAYEVLSALGAGGMGEVYRARDTRLSRDVAIKVLPAERLADEHRRRRFQQEARALSSLNHPHIVTIYEVESAGAVDFIVMEFVRGSTLDQLIPSRGFRVSELLRIAVPVAEALAAAHARGIIHRDVKPANLMVGDDGVVKVLDFGLAKLLEPDEEPGAATATDLRHGDVSALGRIAGTPAYMAPEQASGGKVDARSDVFSFGAVLYQMATGARAFDGNSSAETLAAVLAGQPKPPTQITAVPRELERVILRCLRKEPDRRYQTMLDVRNDLQELEEEIQCADVPGWRPGRSGVGSRWPSRLGLLPSAAAVTWSRWSRTGIPPPPMQVRSVTGLDGYEMMPSLSPDGNQVAFAWNGDKDGSNVDVYVSMIGTPAVHRLTTHPAMDVFPRWSPDGRQIAFVRQWTDHAGRVYVVSPLGGPERKLSDFDAHFDRVAVFGDLSWSPDGRYIAAARSSTQREGESTGIYLIPVEGGEPRLVTPAKAPASDQGSRDLTRWSSAGLLLVRQLLLRRLRRHDRGARRRAPSDGSAAPPDVDELTDGGAGLDARWQVPRIPTPDRNSLLSLARRRRRSPSSGAHRSDRSRGSAALDCAVSRSSGLRPSHGRHGYLSGWAQGLGARSQPVLVPRFLPHVLTRRQTDRVLFRAIRRYVPYLGRSGGRLRTAAAHR